MWWECSECGIEISRGFRPLRCPECGVAGHLFVPAERDEDGAPSTCSRRDLWLLAGIDRAADRRPLDL
jgi:predicted  nucleic acid-binding Zn-ribbon protein